MMDRSDDPLHHERTLLPWSYILLHVVQMLLRDFVNCDGDDKVIANFIATVMVI